MPTIQRDKTEVLSVSLPKGLKLKALKYAKKQGVSLSQIVKQKLENQIWLEEFDKVSEEFTAAFKKLGINTDEDVEKYFS